MGTNAHPLFSAKDSMGTAVSADVADAGHSANDAAPLLDVAAHARIPNTTA